MTLHFAELFDEEVERLSLFDPLTGQIVSLFHVLPSTRKNALRHTARAHRTGDGGDQRRAGRQTQSAVGKQQTAGRAKRLTQRTQFDLEMMNELGYCSGIENYCASSPVVDRVSHRRRCLITCLPMGCWVDESHVTIPQIGGMYRGDRARKETLVEYGFRLPSALDNRPLFEEFD